MGSTSRHWRRMDRADIPQQFIRELHFVAVRCDMGDAAAKVYLRSSFQKACDAQADRGMVAALVERVPWGRTLRGPSPCRPCVSSAVGCARARDLLGGCLCACVCFRLCCVVCLFHYSSEMAGAGHLKLTP